MATLPFLKDILSGTKRMVNRNELRICQKLEKFDSLTIANLIGFGMERINNFADYLPDDYQNNKSISREYVSNVGSFNRRSLIHYFQEASRI